MKLTSPDRTQVSLRPIAYEFPDRVSAAAAGTDWDANWLIVKCEARTTQGQEWGFQEPCLTAWEARELVPWLDAIATGEAQPDPDVVDDAHDMSFTEPVIAFSLEQRHPDHSRIRVYFSLEGLPPWLPGRLQLSVYEWYLTLDVDHDDLTEAVREWRQECSAFPTR